jgi:hypothetical protein
MTIPEAPSSQQLAGYVTGELSPQNHVRVARALSGSAALANEREALHALHTELQGLADCEAIDVTGCVMREISQQRRSLCSPWRQALAGAAVCALAAGVLIARVPGSTVHMRSKAAGALAVAPEASVQMYAVSSDGHAAVRSAIMHPDEGWLFSYSNGDTKPYRYLMVFAVDERGKVYWFHPAYTSAATDPQSIGIQPSVERVLLPEAVHHRFERPQVQVVSLFSMTPIAVSAVEAWARRAPRQSLSAAFGPHTHTTITTVHIAP